MNKTDLVGIKAVKYCFLKLAIWPAMVAMVLAINQPLIAQPHSFAVNEWVNKLASKDDLKNQHLTDAILAFENLDSATTAYTLAELKKAGETKGNYFKARFNCLKAITVYRKNHSQLNRVRTEIKETFAQAMRSAYETGDEYLVGFISKNYGGHMYAMGEYELATTYHLSSLEIVERLFGHDEAPVYIGLGEMFFRIREYEKCISNTLKGIQIWQDTMPMAGNTLYMRPLNTLALGYHRLAQYDSAFYFYRQALQIANIANNEVWMGIISGNMGQIYYAQKKYDTAKALLEMDYRNSKQAGYLDNAANSLQWVARTNLSLGNNSLALQQVREAINLLQVIPDANYLHNTLYTAADIFKVMGNTDSAYYYSERYNRLHDSLEKVINLSSVAIAEMRANNERSMYRIRNLQQEKELQRQYRNFTVAIIIFLALIALLLVNRKRLQLKHAQELVLQQKINAEREVATAREQLKIFKANIVEKTALIEKLEKHSDLQELSREQNRIIAELSEQTILTDEDWEEFKLLYEKLYPNFFIKIRRQVPYITPAELRMAAIIRLQLGTRETASMLGISLDSVHKTRQRLRQRLQLENNQNLDEVIGEL